MSDLPSGTVTFLFTDVEGSTRLWAANEAAMATSLEFHDALVRRAIELHGGYVFTTAGDAFCAAFPLTADAAAAAAEAQAQLAAADWGEGPPLRVRMGLHMGQAEERGADYFGPTVNLAARVEAAGHGGQILATEPVVSAIGAQAADLGEHRLRGFDAPVRLFQIGEGAFPPPRAAKNLSLPVPPTALVGRLGEVAELRSMFITSRLVTITGVGGCGKTRLALEVAHREAEAGRANVFWVDLSGSDGNAVLSNLATSTGVVLDGTFAPVEQLSRFFNGRSALVVMDNCEHVLDDAADLIDALMARCQDLSVLATSREALEVPGELTWRVPSLGTGPRSDAVRLFVERALASEPRFETGNESLQTVDEICHRLDGIPLAIELAAARVRSMSAEEILSRLDDRFRLLGGSRRRSRQRQQTLEAAVQWSYDLLDENEQRLLRSLAVFRGGFDVSDVTAIAGMDDFDTIDSVDSLVAKSLVETARDGDGGIRHSLLETVRLFALAQLVSAGEADELRNRHLEHFATEQTRNPTLSWVAPAIGSRREREFENIASAISWAAETGQPETSVRLAALMSGHFMSRGQGTHVMELIDQPADLDTAGLVLKHCALGWLYLLELFDLDKVEEHTERAGELADGDLSLPGAMSARRVQLTLGMGVMGVPGKEPGWEELYAQAIDAGSREISPANVLTSRATHVSLSGGDLEAVIGYCNQAEEVAMDGEIRMFEPLRVQALLGLGAYQEADLAANRMSPPPPGLPMTQMWSITRDLAMGANGQAQEASHTYAVQAGDLLDRHPRLAGELIVGFAFLALVRGETDRALELAEASVPIQLVGVKLDVLRKAGGSRAEQLVQNHFDQMQRRDPAEQSERAGEQERLLREELAAWAD